MRYIGGKTLLIDSICGLIDELKDVKSVLDIFSGSTVVAEALKKRNYKVFTNDFLYFSYVLARGTLGIKKKPNFSGIGNIDVFEYLNNLTLSQTPFSLEQCFIYSNYSPNEKCDRLYFQNDNAIKIDIIRLTIQKWFDEGVITDDEYYYLLASLIRAVPFVSNITGVYAAYLKHWDTRTYKKLELLPITFEGKYITKCFNRNFIDVVGKKVDLIYADPPYNSREYLPNYHILETIAKYDYPVIKGITGMRQYDLQKSDFCKSAKVEDAFRALLGKANSKYVLISYNNEGLIDTNTLFSICSDYSVEGECKLIEVDYRRYKSKIPNNKAGLKEQLYLVKKYE